jgi:hypothetical protein
LEGVVLLALLYLLSRRKPPLPQGSYVGIFMIGYAIFRIVIETGRQPDAHIGYLFGTEWVTMGMMLSAPMLLVGAGFLIYAWRTRRPQRAQDSALARESASGADRETEENTFAPAPKPAPTSAPTSVPTSAPTSAPGKTSAKTSGKTDEDTPATDKTHDVQ